MESVVVLSIRVSFTIYIQIYLFKFSKWSQNTGNQPNNNNKMLKNKNTYRLAFVMFTIENGKTTW